MVHPVSSVRMHCAQGSGEARIYVLSSEGLARQRDAVQVCWSEFNRYYRGLLSNCTVFFFVWGVGGSPYYD